MYNNFFKRQAVSLEKVTHMGLKNVITIIFLYNITIIIEL